MRLSVLILSVVFAAAITGSGFAQATLPDDAVNSANNPGSVRNAAPAHEQALDCTCRITAPGADAAGSIPPGGSNRQADPDDVSEAGDETFACTCGEAAPDTTGALTAPKSDRGPDAAVPGAAGIGPVPAR
ncbi:hypothetical protein MKK69_23325 [Methylobacterium sp. J-026]|uniref:hypothetical protein n=1 Tax=Methylobacterium sp. J-026 TaxID=2836624 RepID=UPI001FB912D0|nr:hypothetical protein [Methylobacterium sp. J-026]MCJ2136944.1 hypothetical protein [Methylobacterium sp. J-026]